mmetsp:Transcript_23200/g.41479  ORF Transcript_23200/g.41479 Transcript_23200/m.41479 type:complete len:95 (-) Transcript_23200:219-503(-)
MHESATHWQSPLHQLAPFPWGHSEHFLAECPPQCTGVARDENNPPVEDNLASVDGTRRATATAKNFMLNYSREESRWMMFGERGLNGLCDVMTV